MVVLDGASLTIESLAAIAEGGDKAILAPAARDRMAEARKVVEEAMRSEAAVYGLTTAKMLNLLACWRTYAVGT